MNNKSTPKNNADKLHPIQNPLSQLSDDVLEHASEAIQEQVRLATEKIEQEKNGFLRRLKAWASAQLSRISNTIIALLAATLMTVAMPYLVKLEMDSELNSLTSTLTGLITANVSEQVNNRAQTFDKKDLQIENAISSLQLTLKEMQANSRNDQYPILAVQLNGLKLAQQNNHDKIAGLVNTLQIDQTSNQLSSKLLHSKINSYILSGKELLQDNTVEADIKSWLGEVYYFVSMMKLDAVDLTTAKQTLKDLYQLPSPLENALENQDLRIQKSLIILNVLHEWLKLSPH
mgnify:CR=1 FL=1